MKTDNYEEIARLIKELMELYNNIYDYDYDRDALYYIREAIDNLRRI